MQVNNFIYELVATDRHLTNPTYSIGINNNLGVYKEKERGPGTDF